MKFSNHEPGYGTSEQRVYLSRVPHACSKTVVRPVVKPTGSKEPPPQVNADAVADKPRRFAFYAAYRKDLRSRVPRRCLSPAAAETRPTTARRRSVSLPAESL
jgi:hypothetical protein